MINYPASMGIHRWKPCLPAWNRDAVPCGWFTPLNSPFFTPPFSSGISEIATSAMFDSLGITTLIFGWLFMLLHSLQ